MTHTADLHTAAGIEAPTGLTSPTFSPSAALAPRRGGRTAFYQERPPDGTYNGGEHRVRIDRRSA